MSWSHYLPSTSLTAFLAAIATIIFTPSFVHRIFLVACMDSMTFAASFIPCLVLIACVDHIAFPDLLYSLSHTCKKTRQDPPLMPRFLFHPTRPPDPLWYRRGRTP